MKLLEDPVSYVRFVAAQALCRLGRREGVPLILESARSNPESRWFLVILNQVRRPGVWEKVRKAEGDLKTLAEKAGLRIEESFRFEFRPDAFWISKASRLPEEDLRRFFIRVVPRSREIVLEDDRLRVLYRDEALKFWSAWWAEERKKHP